MNAYAALAIVCGICAGAAFASTMGVLVLSGKTNAALQIEGRSSITMPVSGTVSALSSDSFLLTEDPSPYTAAKSILIHYDKDSIMLVRTFIPDQHGAIVDSHLLRTQPATTLKNGLRVRVTLWLTAEYTHPYAMMIHTSPTQ